MMDSGLLAQLCIALVGLAALAEIAALYLWLCRQSVGTGRMKEMIIPTLVGVALPIAVGFLMGPWALAFYMIGVEVVGATLSIFMFNAGGAWDNAKKYVEEGRLGGRGSEPHRAGIVGDTFGDPLKDTAGPAMNILIKLQNILSITLLPLFYLYGGTWNQAGG